MDISGFFLSFCLIFYSKARNNITVCIHKRPTNKGNQIKIPPNGGRFKERKTSL